MTRRIGTDQLVEQAKAAIGAGDEDGSIRALAALGPVFAEVSPIAAVDLLERACTLSTTAVVEAVYQAFPELAYESWALALALRCANEPVARLLLDRGVDLLGEVRQPTSFRALLPHEGSFTRFDLTRTSPTLFLNPMDPTVSTEVFEPFRGRANESLSKPAYAAPTDLAATCDLVARLASEGRFDAVVFDDLLRAALVRAWHALRHEGEHDEEVAETCLSLGARMLEMYHMRGQGDEYVRLILGNLIVPKAHPRIVSFVCDEAPAVFLERLHALTWLRADVGLVAQMVPHLSPSTPERNGTLLVVLARAGRMAELELLANWQETFTAENVDAAMQAAAEAGHAEAAAWLLARRPRAGRGAQGDADGVLDLDELLL